MGTLLKIKLLVLVVCLLKTACGKKDDPRDLEDGVIRFPSSKTRLLLIKINLDINMIACFDSPVKIRTARAIPNPEDPRADQPKFDVIRNETTDCSFAVIVNRTDKNAGWGQSGNLLEWKIKAIRNDCKPPHSCGGASCYDFGFGYTCTSTPAPVNSPICPKTIFKGKQQINGTTDYFRYESTFEPIWFKETGFSTEVCPDGRSLASVLCRYDGRNPAFYDPTTIDISLCGQNLADVELAVNDFKYLTFSPTKLQQFMGIVQLMVSSPQNITIDNITVATNLSETLADTIPGNTANSSDVTAHAARGVLLLANHLNIAYGNPNYNLTQILKEMGNITANYYKNKLLRSLEKLLRLVTLDNTTLEIESPLVKAKVEDKANVENCSEQLVFTFNPLEYHYNGPTIAVRYAEKVANVSMNLNPRNATALEEWLELNNRTKCPTARVAHAYYLNTNLFPNGTRVDQVVSVNVTGLELDNFDSLVEVNFFKEKAKRGAVAKNNTPLINTVTEFQCGFWNRYDFPLKKYWQIQTDCRRVLSGDGFPRCYCRRPGSYSNLIEVVDLPADFVLEALTYSGSSMSIAALFSVFLIYSLIRSLRTRKTSGVLLHIVICMCLSYCLFISILNLTQYDYVCYAGTMLLHYFLLVTWAWTNVNAYHMYRALVKVLAAEIENPLLKACVYAYGMPAVVVGVNVGVTVFYLDNNQDRTSVLFESNYRRQNMCWLNIYSMYYGFLVPVGAMLSFNLVMFYVLLRKLTWKKQQLQSSAAVQGTKDQLKIAFLLVTMMGLTWSIAYLMLISTDVTFLSIMRYLFTIFNVLQGFLIFLLNCVIKKSVRDQWMPEIKKTKSWGCFYQLKKIFFPSRVGKYDLEKRRKELSSDLTKGTDTTEIKSEATSEGIVMKNILLCESRSNVVVNKKE